MTDLTTIKSWHAHIYFDGKTVDQARKLADAIDATFDVEKGRVHEGSVANFSIGRHGPYCRT